MPTQELAVKFKVESSQKLTDIVSRPLRVQSERRTVVSIFFAIDFAEPSTIAKLQMSEWKLAGVAW